MRADVGRRHAEVLQKGGVVGAAAQIADLNIILVARAAGSRSACPSDLGSGVLGALLLFLLGRGLPLVVDAAALGTGHRLGDIAQVLLQAGHRRRAEVGPGNRDIHVEVRHSARQFLGVLLGKLGRADQAFFFRIPTGEDQGALGTPSGLQQLSDAMHRFQLRGGAAVGIDRAIHPGIAMIAGDHPLVGKLRSVHHANHVPDGHVVIVQLDRHVHLHRSRTDVIGEGQRALPARAAIPVRRDSP